MVELDLFGDPVDPRRGLAGRPRHMPTDAQRAQARALRSDGLPLLVIAHALGITVPTLQLNYPDELNSTSQAWRRRAERDRKE